MAKVGIDLRCLPTDGSAGAGVAHATRFLVQALTAKSVPWLWNIYLPAGARFETSLPTIALKDNSGSSLRLALRQHPSDCLFVPGGSVAPGISTPQIPWVHDVAIFPHPEWFPQSVFRRTLTTRLFQRGVRRAPVVFAVSQDTARELENQLGLDATKIQVTQAGGEPLLAMLHGDELRRAKQLAKTRVAATGVTNAFILVMGTVEPRKNLAMLIHAWHEAQSSFNRPVDLVVAGRDGWKMKDVHAIIKDKIRFERDGSRLHRFTAVDDEARRDLLLAADMVALPSLHEGFGLVALEAMQAETALVASRVGAIPEVVGEEGILLDPQESAEWSKALSGLMNDDDARQDVAFAGKARSQRFDWERTALVIKQGIADFLGSRG